ncbi:MAG: peptidase [Proteobacteria bacterium]|nr:peptidase [Pseudomonadota bacterium]
MKKIISLGLVCFLAACGGGGGGGSSNGVATSTLPGRTTFPPSSTYANLCASPRANTADRQGTTENEKTFLRSFIDETYLWYRDVPNVVAANYATPQSYFDVLKTTAKTSSGKDVDQFHWSQTTESWNASSSGITQDYGIKWAAQASVPPRSWIVAQVAPGSPAALAGIKRGDKLTSVDGVDFVNDGTEAGVAVLNAGLFPTTVSTHGFGLNGNAEISLTPATITTVTVQNVKTITSTSGTVGYFIFDTHIAKSEAELIAAINQLKAANVTDLVIDLRYNGGGLLYIASELAYMIAGPSNTDNKIFEKLIFNDKLTAQNEIFPFYATGTADQTLPYLGLKHVSLLVTQNTASASEAIINGLRGVDVTVDLIGDTTRGKPYGFVPQDNCGYTYFAIQFKGVNEKGYGDYADGFSPTCSAADDFTHELGDTAETMLQTALTYRQTGTCPTTTSRFSFTTGAPLQSSIVRPASQEMRIITRKPHL